MKHQQNKRQSNTFLPVKDYPATPTDYLSCCLDCAGTGVLRTGAAPVPPASRFEVITLVWGWCGESWWEIQG